MRLIFVCLLLAGPSALAAEFDDRAEIERVVRAAQFQLDTRPPWSEVTAPHLVIGSIRFITPDVALVDASNVQYGSVILLRRIPVLIVLTKESRHWRIAVVRTVDSCAALQ